MVQSASMTRRSFIASSAGITSLRLNAAEPLPERKFQLGCVTYNLLKDMDLETMIRTLEAAGVKWLSDGKTCELQSPDAAERKRQIESGKSFVDLARDTGALGVKVRPNGMPDGVPYETTIKNISDGLRELADYGQTKGVEIWMEVHGRRTQEPKISAEILKTTAHKNVGACWNSNPTDVKDGSVKESFDLLKPFLRSAHINELYSSYPWREFFRLLRESGYNRYTLAEVAESKEPERFLHYYQALWRQLSA